MGYKVAIASTEGIAVDVHFGQADSFAIFEVDSSTGHGEFLEWREAAESLQCSDDSGCGVAAEPAACGGVCGGGSGHDPRHLRQIAERLRDSTYVLVAKIGGRANAVLASHGLHVIEASGDVGPALVKLNRYYLLQHRNDRPKPAVAARVEPEAAPPALPELPVKPAGAHRVAIASSDGKFIDQHFGHADRFIIVDVASSGYSVVGKRAVPPACDGTDEPSKFRHTAQLLKDCDAVFVSRIGKPAAQAMFLEGIRVFEAPYFIEDVLNKLIADGLLDGPPTQ